VAIEERFLDSALAKFATAPLGMTNRAERSELDYFFFAADFGAKALALFGERGEASGVFHRNVRQALCGRVRLPRAFSPWIN